MRGAQEACAAETRVSGFMLTVSVSGSSLTKRSQDPSWWHASLGQDGFQREGSWEAARIGGVWCPF